MEIGGTPKTNNDELWDGEIIWLTPKEITNDRKGLFVSDTERKITELRSVPRGSSCSSMTAAFASSISEMILYVWPWLGLTRFGQMQFSRSPVEQPRAELLFQRVDPVRYG